MSPETLIETPRSPAADVTIIEHEGSIEVRDPRMFRAAQRGFCRRLVEQAALEPRIRRVEVNLDSATARMDFAGVANAQELALAFAAAVRKTSEPSTESAWWERTESWSSLTAFRSDGHSSVWETLEVNPGRIRIRHQGLPGDRARVAKLAGSLDAQEGVVLARRSFFGRSLFIDMEPGIPVLNRLIDTLEESLEDFRALELGRPGSTGRPIATTATPPVPVVRGLQRLRYMVLAAGSGTLTLVAFLVPGVPTLPFLMATSYYLARSSPRLDSMLRHTAFLGPILEEWEYHGGLSWTSKGKLIGMSLTILLVTVSLTSLSPVIWGVVAILYSLSIYEIVRMPSPSEHPGAAPAFHRSATLALPAP